MFSILSDGKMIEFDRYDHTYCRVPRIDDDGSSNKKKPTTITVEIQSGAHTIHSIPPVVPTLPAATIDVAPREPVIIVKKKKNRRQLLAAQQNAVNSGKPKLTLPVLENTDSNAMSPPEEAPSTVVIVSPAPEIGSISDYDNVGAEVAVNGGSSPEVKPEILKAKRPVKRKPKPAYPNMPVDSIDDQEPPTKSPRKAELVTIPKPSDMDEEVVIPVEVKVPEEQSNGIEVEEEKEEPMQAVEHIEVEKPKPVKEVKTPKVQSPPPVVVTSSGRTRKTPSKFLEPPEEIKTPRQKKSGKKGNKKTITKLKNNKKQLKKSAKTDSATKSEKPAKPSTPPETLVSDTAAAAASLDTEENKQHKKTPSLSPISAPKPSKSAIKPAKSPTNPVKSTTKPAKPAANKAATANRPAAANKPTTTKKPAAKTKSKGKKEAIKVVVPQSSRGKAKVANKQTKKTKLDKSIPAAKIDLTNIIARGRRRR